MSRGNLFLFNLVRIYSEFIGKHKEIVYDIGCSDGAVQILYLKVLSSRILNSSDSLSTKLNHDIDDSKLINSSQIVLSDMGALDGGAGSPENMRKVSVENFSGLLEDDMMSRYVPGDSGVTYMSWHSFYFAITLQN